MVERYHSRLACAPFLAQADGYGRARALRRHLSIEWRSGMACPEPEASFIRMLTFWEDTLIWLARFRVDRSSSSP